MKDRRKILIIALLGSASAGLIVHALHYPFISDDAYISFRYSYNLAHHQDLSFNLGDRVEGYTNFLWTLLLGLLLKVGWPPEIMARILGVFFGVGGLVLLYLLARLYRGGGRPTGWDCLGSLMLSASTGFVVWCSGGLETQMFTALVLSGALLYLTEHTQRVRWRLSGILFALSAMTRPEGLLFFSLTVLHRFAANLFGQKRWRPSLAEMGWVAGFLLPFGIFFLWRFLYYGYPFPNTYYVKAQAGASANALKWGLPYLKDFVRENKLYVLLPLLLFFRPRAAEIASPDGTSSLVSPDGEKPSSPLHPTFVWSYVSVLVLPFTAYVTLVGGDFMTLGRFFVPILPFLAFFAQEGLRELVERPSHLAGTWHPLRMATVALILLPLLVANSYGLYRENQKRSYYRWGLDTIAYLEKFANDRIIIGQWMRENLPPDTSLAVGGAGAIVYASRLKSIDTFGLNDRWIAHHTSPVGDRPGHTKSAPEDYLLRLQPDLMCHMAKHQDSPYHPDSATEHHWRQKGYSWVCLNPPRLSPAYYCCLKRLDRNLGPFPAEVGS